MELFNIILVENDENSNVEVDGDTEISTFLKDRLFHKVLHDGETLDPSLYIKETCITPGDEIYIVRKNPDEPLENNLIVNCPEISKKYEEPDMKILISKEQRICDVLLFGLFIDGLNHECPFVRVENNVIYFPLPEDFSLNMKCPDFNILEQVTDIEKPWKPNNYSRKIIYPDEDYHENSELFIYDKIVEEDIIYPEFEEYSIEFNNLLIEHSCVVAGSYMLKYLGLIENPGDIDIFGITFDFVQGLLSVSCDKKINIYVNDMGTCISYKLYGFSDICINYVQIKEKCCSNMIEYVRTNFDISPCITAYDGCRIYMNSKLKKMEMDCYIDGCRILKYVERGFKIRKYLGNNKTGFYNSHQLPHSFFMGKIDNKYRREIFSGSISSYKGLALVAVCINKKLINEFSCRWRILDAFVPGFFHDV